MLVGIRIIPKRPVEQEEEEEEEEPQIYSSPESSRRGSLSSRGSHADNSDLDSDNEDDHHNGTLHGSLNGSEANGKSGSRKSEPQREIEEALDRIWKFISFSEERLMFLRGLGEKAQEAIRDVYSFGEVIVSGGLVASSLSATTKSDGIDTSTAKRAAGKSGSRRDAKKETMSRAPPPEVELTAVKSSKHHHHSRKHKDREQQQEVKEAKPRRPLFDDDDDNNEDDLDPDSFQTVRYKPRTDSHSSTRPKLSILVDTSATGTGATRGKRPSLDTPRHQSMPGGLPRLPHSASLPPVGAPTTSRQYSSPPYQQTQFSHHQTGTTSDIHAAGNMQDPTIWSHGVPSLGLPDGYEAVYYFGLIDVLQKYNLVKWLERNIKGANVRLLGSGNNNGGGSSPMTPGPPMALPLPQMVIHPGRSNPSTSSTSFASSAFYQLLPHATASEPSLPSVVDPSSAVASGAAQGATTNPALSVLLEDPSSGHRSSSSTSTTFSSQDNSRSNRGSLLLEPTSSYSHSSTPLSSARVSQEESTLTSSITSPILIEGPSKVAPPSISHSPSPSSTSILNANKPRLSTSAPFTKSIANAAARLSQYSQYSHSSQQSQHSHQSGRSRDSRLSFDIRASNASESMMFPPNHHLYSSSSSSPSSSDGVGGGVQIHIPPGQATQAAHQTQTQAQQPRPANYPHQYQAPQHAEVSVEEPGRYAERLIDFMRGVLV